MAETESTMKWKVDVTSFTAAMQEAKKALQSTNQEFKLTTSTMDKWQNDTAGVEAKIKQLGNTLEANQRILDIYNTAWEEAKQTFGETSPEAERLAKKVEEQQIKINKTQVQLDKYNEKLNQMQAEQKESSTASEKLNSTIEEQESQLASLKNAYKDAVIQYGKNSDEAKELATQIDKLSSELKENKTQMAEADKAADALDNSLDEVDDSARSASDGFTVMKGALANLVSQGISKVVSGLKDLAKQTFDAGANFESSMSNVAAISGATGSEIEKLTAKAEEMGSKTKFTASEAADAFSYMAMAGWKTEDMLNGIEGIMNLAAASGADLATTSDIVTDALTAMGYSAEDAGRLADVMAAASSNANTNVEMMGQTFQYAAPIVGALGYSMEDTAVAIGLMANAGIKGEKAGTALRSMLTRLAAPTSEMEVIMDEFSISLTDAEGKMKPFSEVLGDMRVAFADCDETVQAYIAKAMAGQEAMSGFLSIINASPEDFNKLTKAVENSAGAAEHMANVMNDNVSGQITLLKSKIEGIMIKVFEKASGSIKKAIDTISKALDKVDWDKFAEGAGNAAEAVADLFAFVVKNGDKIIEVLKTIAISFVTYKAVATITDVTTAFTVLFNAVKSGQGIMETLNKVMGMNPYALVAAGIAALTVGIIKYSEKQYDATMAEYRLSEAQQESLNKVHEMAKAYDDLDQARNISVANITTEFGYLQQLKDEYNGLIDANGNVKEGYEDRAAFILTTLADAMGIELDQVSELIDANGKLGESIDQLIIKKQAEATLSANEQIYTEAIRNRADSLKTLTDAQDTLREAEEKYFETKEDAEEVWNTYQELMEKNVDAAVDYLGKNSELILGNSEAKAAWEEASKAVGEAEEAWIGYNSTIQNYEGLSAAIISGDTAKIETALTNMQYNFITAETGNRESLERQVKDMEQNYNAMKDAIANNTPGVTQEMLTQAKAMVDAAKGELDKLPDEAAASGAKSGQAHASGINSTLVMNRVEALNVGLATVEGADEGSAGMNETGMHAGAEFILGVKANNADANSAGNTLGSTTNEGAVNGASPMNNSGVTAGSDFVSGVNSQAGNANSAGQNVGSNANGGAVSGSSPMNKSGSNAGGQFVSGVRSQLANSLSGGNALGSNANSGAVSGSSRMNSSGSHAGGSFVSGVNSKAGSANSAGKNLGNNAKSGADSVDASGSGSNFASGFINGIGGWISSAWSKGWELAKAAWNGLRAGQEEGSPSKLTRRSGVFFGEGFEQGIDSMIKPVTSAASAMASEAVGALSVQMNDQMRDIGEESGNSLISGINGVIPKVSGSISELKGSIASANNGISGVSENVVGNTENAKNVQNVTFNQYNNSPKALDRLTIYRDTNNMLFSAKVRLGNV